MAIQETRVRSYRVLYVPSTSTRRSLVTSITEIGEDGSTSLPSQTFAYTQPQIGFGTAVDLAGVLNTQGQTPIAWKYIWGATDEVNTPDVPFGFLTTFFDIDGDALPDRVMRASASPYGRFAVQPMLSTGGLYEGGTFDWLPVEVDPLPTGVSAHIANCAEARYNKAWVHTFSTLLDLNGDGLPDRIRRRDPPAINPYLAYEVQLNDGRGFQGTDSWPISDVGPISQERAAIQNSDIGDQIIRMMVAFADMNGDGLPDRILRKTEAPYTNFWIQLNTGSGFASPRKWISIHPINANIVQGSITAGRYTLNAVFHTFQNLQDINGDGLPDRVYKSNSSTSWDVQLNNGSGFEPVEPWINVACGGNQNDAWRGHPSQFADVNGDGLADWFDTDSVQANCADYERFHWREGIRIRPLDRQSFEGKQLWRSDEFCCGDARIHGHRQRLCVFTLRIRNPGKCQHKESTGIC